MIREGAGNERTYRAYVSYQNIFVHRQEDNRDR